MPGYQNFFICIEMFFGAIALRFAFPSNIYKDGQITQQVIEVSVKMRTFRTGVWFFLVACTRLYRPLCRSVRRSVGPSVTLYFFFAKWLIELRVRDLWRSALFDVNHDLTFEQPYTKAMSDEEIKSFIEQPLELGVKSHSVLTEPTIRDVNSVATKSTSSDLREEIFHESWTGNRNQGWRPNLTWWPKHNLMTTLNYVICLY